MMRTHLESVRILP